MRSGIAPGGLATLMGQGLAPTIQGVITDPNQMSGYSVVIDGEAAPILALVNQNGVQQINVQIPFDTSPTAADRSVTVLVETPQGSIEVNTGIPVSVFAPGLFANGTLTAIGGPYALASAVRPDGSYVSATNPAMRGEIITVFATGLGQTSPPTSTGAVGVGGQAVSNTLLATVNQRSASVVSATYQPGTLGVYTVQVEIPSSTPAGPAQPLNLVMLDASGNAYMSPLVYVPIQ
jgi:uncharacterized protein (TIGR03437 family)